MKKVIVVLLSLILVSGLFAGCHSQEEHSRTEAASEESVTVDEKDSNALNPAETTSGSEKDNNALNPAETTSGSEKDNATAPAGKTDEESKGTDEQKTDGTEKAAVRKKEVKIDDVSYVMIYNPLIYDELDEYDNAATSLYSGDFSSQIITGMNRADDLDIDKLKIPAFISQWEINDGLDESAIDFGGIKAGEMDPIYKVHDKHLFFHDIMSNRRQSEFECVYAGKTCYIWSLNGSIDAAAAEELAMEFDSVIYPTDVEEFGTPRFVDHDGKVNILFYPMSEGIGGFFSRADIYSSGEVPLFLAQMSGMNTDHAIININSYYLKENQDFLKSTLAHELQHLICASDRFYYEGSKFMRTWLNEAMSAHAEELVYPGIKEEYSYSSYYYYSDNYRTGQSLYNFENDTDLFKGAYGVAYLFEEYLKKNSGKDIFSSIHEYWRKCYSSDVTEAEALANTLNQEYAEKIQKKYTYPESISRKIGNSDDELMSKMALDFFIETLSIDPANMEEEDFLHYLMLYSRLSPVEIEGGGKIIVAVEGDSFTIPEDSDEELLYLGLDENFKVITDPISVYQ